MFSFIPCAITQPFFEIQNPDFAWKFVCTDKIKTPITRPFFELQTPDFAWKFVWTVPTNYAK